MLTNHISGEKKPDMSANNYYSILLKCKVIIDNIRYENSLSRFKRSFESF